MPDRSELISLVLIQPAMADTVAGAADYRGKPASRSGTGGWKSSAFVMGTFPICSSSRGARLRRVVVTTELFCF